MLHRLFEKLTYSEEDWCVMQKAHIKACELLGQPSTNAERLAKTVMKLFDAGERDVKIIAAMAAHRENRLRKRAEKVLWLT
jgi:hypothetical protein